MAQQTPATQSFVDVQTIHDGVVTLKGGALRRILIVNGVNFDLKSEAEQGLILGGFQNFLNALDFPVQCFIHSRKVNIERYLASIAERKATEPNELLKIQIDEYISFVRSFVDENAIIEKTFFIVVPYNTTTGSAATRGIFSLFGKKSAQDTAAEQSHQASLAQLDERVSQVVDGLNQIGLHALPLDDESLTEFFYNLYNPQLVEKKDIGIAKQ